MHGSEAMRIKVFQNLGFQINLLNSVEVILIRLLLCYLDSKLMLDHHRPASEPMVARF